MENSTNSKITPKQIKQILIAILFFIVGVMSASLYKQRDYTVTNKSIISHDSGTYKFTSPILDCEPGNQGDESVIPYKTVSTFVDTMKKKYSIEFISVYFRDLNDGPWIGIKEKELFSPASLLKVPLMMAFLKYAEEHPLILNKKVIVTETDKKPSSLQDFKPNVYLEVGKEYTLKEVLEHTVEYSDNTGVTILSRSFPPRYISDVYTAIGVEYTESSNDLAIRIKDYSAFFRVLFNASYLDRDMSEMALDILTKTQYKDGIVAGVPYDVMVSHKFGERTSGDVSLNGKLLTGQTQLHDCGIVYYPGRPYALCIMTRGTNFADQQNAIKDLSGFFYKKIDDLHNK